MGNFHNWIDQQGTVAGMLYQWNKPKPDLSPEAIKQGISK